MAHVVLDPDAWLAHAVASFGEAKAREFLAAKVARHKPAYDAAVKAGQVATRAEREAAQPDLKI